MDEVEDLFDNYDALPNEVKAVLEKHSEMDNTYENCDKLISDLNEIGYTCDYGLDAIPYELKKL